MAESDELNPAQQAAPPEADELTRTVSVVRVGLRGLYRSQLPRMAAALAYRTIFSVIPVLAIVLVIASSFVEPAQEGAPRADDVMFGAHVGFGAEVAVHSMASLFADLQFNGYMGHDRASEGWTGGVDEELQFFWNLQLNLGAQFHAGR